MEYRTFRNESCTRKRQSVGFSIYSTRHIYVFLFLFRNYGLTIQDEFEVDGGIISGSFDNIFDMGIIGTLTGSIWYICWTSERSKTRLVGSHTDRITGLIPIEDTHIVTSSLDGTIRIFQIEDRNEILRFDANGLVKKLIF